MPERSIKTQIEIKAPPERVFDAWTTPEHLLAWWHDDQNYRGLRWDIDLKTGGKWLCVGLSGSGENFQVKGEYLEIERPKRLSFTWEPDWDAPVITTVTIELAPTSTGTLLTLTHSGFTTDQSQSSHDQGWSKVLARLQTWTEQL